MRAFAHQPSSFSSYALSTLSVPATLPGAGDATVGKTDTAAALGASGARPLERESDINCIIRRRDGKRWRSGGPLLTAFVSCSAPFQFLAELPESSCWTHPDRPQPPLPAPGTLANLRGWDRGVWDGHLSR